MILITNYNTKADVFFTSAFLIVDLLFKAYLKVEALLLFQSEKESDVR